MKILVTGGAGYIGSCLVSLLSEKGESVVVLDKLLFGEDQAKFFQKKNNVHLIRGDVRHIEDLAKAMKGVEVVVDLAALVGDKVCDEEKETAKLVNVEATKIILEICKYSNVRRFIFASTCSVYGANQNLLTEDSKTKPLSLYAHTKLESENIIHAFNQDLEKCILRLSTVYGPSERMRFDLILNKFTAQAHFDKVMIVHGGNQIRPLVHVRDVAEAFYTCIIADSEKIKNEIFNAGSTTQNFSIAEIAQIVQRELPNTEIITFPKENDKRSYMISSDKMERTLGFKCKNKVENGIRELIQLFDKKVIVDYRDEKYYN